MTKLKGHTDWMLLFVVGKGSVEKQRPSVCSCFIVLASGALVTGADRLWPTAPFAQHLDLGLMSFTPPLFILLSNFYEGSMTACQRENFICAKTGTGSTWKWFRLWPGQSETWFVWLLLMKEEGSVLFTENVNGTVF